MSKERVDNDNINTTAKSSKIVNSGEEKAEQIKQVFTWEKQYYENRIDENQVFIVEFIEQNLIDKNLEAWEINRWEWSSYGCHQFKDMVDENSDSKSLIDQSGTIFTGRYRLCKEYTALSDQASKLFIDLKTHNKAEIHFNTNLYDDETKTLVSSRLESNQTLFSKMKKILWEDLDFSWTWQEVLEKKQQLTKIMDEFDNHTIETSQSLLNKDFLEAKNNIDKYILSFDKSKNEHISYCNSRSWWFRWTVDNIRWMDTVSNWICDIIDEFKSKYPSQIEYHKKLNQYRIRLLWQVEYLLDSWRYNPKGDSWKWRIMDGRIKETTLKRLSWE